ncbi:MAG: carboxypeptidase regulatory-like domain-containing protein [Candidatus Saliniplasma sp.]
MNKKIVITLMIGMMLLSLIPAATVGITTDNEEVSFQVEFPSPQRDGDYVKMDGFSLYGLPGDKKLPQKGYTFELPRDAEVKDVNIEYNLKGKIDVSDVPDAKAPEPLNGEESEVGDFTADDFTERVYTQGNWRGRNVITVTIRPVKESGYYADSAEIFVEYVNGQDTQVVHEETYEMEQTIQNFGEYSVRTTNDDAAESSVDYLIITHDNYTEEIEPLVEWREEDGMRTEVVTVDQIYSEYGDGEDFIKVRRCIQDYYIKYGIDYVLMAGDVDTVPTAYLRNHDDDGDLASDFLYGELTGNWDTDKDGKFGEEGEEDFYPEADVGRLPANTEQEMNDMVDNILTYEKNPPSGDWFNRVVAGSGILDRTPTLKTKLRTYNWTEYMNDMFFEDQGYTFDHLHTANPEKPDQIGPDIDDGLKKSDFNESIGQGETFVNMIGHGSSSGISRSVNSTVGSGHYWEADERPTNGQKMPLMFAHACSVGEFDSDLGDSLAEAAVEKYAIGFVGASRISWGFVYDSNYNQGGTGDAGLNYRFNEQIFNESNYRQGSALMDSKVDYIQDNGVPSSGSGYRDNYFMFNLMGDPAVPIWTDTPDTFSVSHTSNIDAGQDTLSVDVTDSSGNAVADARVTVTGDNVFSTEKTDSSGHAELTVKTTEDVKITVNKHNFEPYQSEISVDSSSSSSILVVDDDDGKTYESYFTDALSGYDYDTWTVSSDGSPSSSTLGQYDAVIWFTGDDYDSTLTSTDQSNLQQYMDNGGKLFVTGQDIGYDIGDSSFYGNYLRANFETDSVSSRSISGQDMSFSISGGDGADNQQYPSAISAVNGASQYMSYDSDEVSAVSYSGDYDLVYFSFGFEAISTSQDRTDVMDTVLSDLGVGGQTTLNGIKGYTVDENGVAIRDTTVTLKQDGNVVNSTTSGEDGSYYFDVEDGQYTIVADDEDFLNTAVTVDVNGLTKQNMTLESKTFNVTGTVYHLTEEDTSEGTKEVENSVSDSTVHISSKTTVTDDNGRYSVSLEKGVYSGRAEAEGYYNSVNRTVISNESDQDYDFRVFKPIDVTFRLETKKDGNMEPVEQAKVYVIETDDEYYTDSNGEIVIEDMEIGEYHYSTSKDGFESGRGTFTLDDKQGANKLVKDTITSKDHATVEGHVYDTNGDPLEGITVTADNEFSSTTDQNGNYKIGEIDITESNDVHIKLDGESYYTAERIHTLKNGEVATQDFYLLSKDGDVQQDVLLVEDAGDKTSSYKSYYTDALEKSDWSYTEWDVPNQGSPSLDRLDSYPVVIWFTGDDYQTTLTSTDQDNLASYMDQGGNLIISGQDIGYDIKDTSFYSDYLKADFVTDAVDSRDVNGQGYSFGISGGDGADNQQYPSEIDPVNGATEYASYGSDKTAGVTYDGDYNLVYLAFGYEAIDDEVTRNDFMEEMLNDVKPEVEEPPQINMTVVDQSGDELDHVSGTVYQYVSGEEQFMTEISAIEREPIRHVPAGKQINVHVSKDGYLTTVKEISPLETGEFKDVTIEMEEEQTKGTIKGTAWESSDQTNGLAGVTVRALAPGFPSDIVINETTTDEDGTYFMEARDSVEMLEFSKEGRETINKENITVEVGETVEVDAVLPPLGNGTLKGYVKNSDSDPISATVSLPGYGEKQTDRSGYYRYQDISEGTYNVTFSVSGYIDVTKQVGIVQGDTRWLNETMEGIAIIKGYVTDNTGEEVKEAQITIGDNQTETDYHGEYSMNVTSGNNTMQLKAEYHQDTTVNFSIEESKTKFMNVTMLQNTSVIGGVFEEDLNGMNKPVTGANVTLYDDQDNVLDETQSGLGMEAPFEFKVNPGTYTVKADDDEKTDTVEGITITENHYEDITLVIEEPEPGIAEGYVEDDYGVAVDDAHVYVEGTDHSDHTDSDGHYKMEGITEFDQLDMQITAEKDGYESESKSFGVNSSETTWTNFTLEEVSTQGILIVDDDDGDSYESYYTEAVEAAGYGYELKQSSELSQGDLQDYTAVIWFTGDDYQNTITSTEQGIISNYLDNGGKLFISGQDIGYHLDDNGDNTFYNDYLHASFNADDSGETAVNMNGKEYSISGGDGADNQDYPDEIDPINGGSEYASYPGGYWTGPQGAAVEYSGEHDVIYFGFGFEAISSSEDRNAVMEDVLSDLTVDQTQTTNKQDIETLNRDHIRELHRDNIVSLHSDTDVKEHLSINQIATSIEHDIVRSIKKIKPF